MTILLDYERTLVRQERVVLSKLGAGHSVDVALGRDRWVRETSTDLHVDKVVADRLIDGVLADLREALGELRKPQQRVTAARVIYAAWRTRGARLHEPSYAPNVGDHMLYMLFDADDLLLYVGITDRGPVRLVEDYRKKPWFPLVCRVEFERYETRAAVEEREKFLINSRAPQHNIQHNRGRQIA